MKAYNQHSFYLPSGDEHLACTALVPTCVKGAVIMLLPFSEERKGTLPLLLELARDLNSNSIASLIFDWRGTGDSSGELTSVDPEDFTSDFSTALAWLQNTLPQIPITAVGVRLSAALLPELAQKHPEIDRVVMLSPCSGSEFTRQLLQRRMVNDMVAYGKARESRAALLKQLQSGNSVDLDGYTFTANMYSWVNTIRLEAPASENSDSIPRLSQALIIPGGHSRKTIEAATSIISSAKISDLRFPPFWNTVGHIDLSDLIRTTADWINRGFTTSSIRTAQPRTNPATTRTELISITNLDSTIRAVIKKPDREPKGGILFLPGWSGDRTGPHRMFTQLASKLVDAGYLTLRPDFRGRGLSDGKHAKASIASMAEDAATALASLKLRVPEGSPLYVVAICSGCKVAITLTADHPQIAKLLLFSAESMGHLRSSKTDSNKTQKALYIYLKKMTQLDTWKKILTGRVQTRMVTKALIKHESRSEYEAKSEDEILKRFGAYRNPMRFVFGGSDPDAPGSMRSYKSYCNKHSIPHSLHLIPHAGHSYYSSEWTADAFETSINFLVKNL